MAALTSPPSRRWSKREPNGWLPATRFLAAATPRRLRRRSKTKRSRRPAANDPSTRQPLELALASLKAAGGRLCGARARHDLLGARAVRGDRQDGRGLLRQLSRL